MLHSWSLGVLSVWDDSEASFVPQNADQIVVEPVENLTVFANSINSQSLRCPLYW